MWRHCAKLVAIIDITVICFISVCVLLSLSIYGYGRLVSNASSGGHQERQLEKDCVEKECTLAVSKPYPPVIKYVLLAAACGIPALIILLLLWTTINLLSATATGEKPEKAKMMATLYRDVSIALFLLAGPAFFLRAQDLIWVVPFIIWRCVSIFVSDGFIKKLERKLETPLHDGDEDGNQEKPDILQV